MVTLLKEKSYFFAVSVVRVVRYLQENLKEYVLSGQFLRSGTSIGALVYEAEFAESRADYIHKLKIALKEANETLYWLNLLQDSGYNKEEILEGMIDSCKELIALLVTLIKKLKSK